MLGGKRIVERSGHARNPGAIPIRRERAAFERTEAAGRPILRCASMSNHLNDGSCRIGAVACTLRATDNFDAFHIRSCEVCEIEISSGFVHLDAIDQK